MDTELKPYSKQPHIMIDSKGMFASIRITSPDAGEEEAHFTIAQMLDFIEGAGIVYGVDERAVASLCADIIYNTDVVIAVGTEPTVGENGYFEYHFSQDFSKKPTIRPDGSADFLSIKVIEVVHENDLIVTYHPAIQGKPGKNVKGIDLEPKPVREMPPLGGRGFRRSEDNLTYYSEMDGKITMQGNRILISPIYEIDQDADMNVGNIDFKGDVVIHGGVKHGIHIHATGSITIDGLVEHCDIRAGKDIFLLSGVKGAEKTTIHAEGAITAEFIEYAMVSCKKDLRVDVLFNCLVNCEGKIIATSGKRSAIIGGNITAVQGLSALSLGNKFGTVTRIVVGVDEERLKETAQLTEKIGALESNIAKIKKGVEDFDALAEKKGISNRDDPRRMQLLRVKIRDEALVAQDRTRLEELREMIAAGRRATVKVYDTVYAGVRIKMLEQNVQMSDYQKKVEFVKTDTGIRMEPLDEPIPDE